MAAIDVLGIIMFVDELNLACNNRFAHGRQLNKGDNIKNVWSIAVCIIQISKAEAISLIYIYKCNAFQRLAFEPNCYSCYWSNAVFLGKIRMMKIL